MIIKIPNREIKNKISAIFSNKISFFIFSVLIDIKEKIHETVRNKAITEDNWSKDLFSVLLVKCNEVIIKRQNPSKLAAVFNICCDVLFAINQ